MSYPIRPVLVLVLAAATLWISPDASAQDLVAIPENARSAALETPVPPNPAVTIGQFENGLAYYIRENREPENRAELRLVVNAGSILEDEDQLGLAHFLEHMAFNGTENFEKQELVAFMESIGMRLGPGVNASTSFDETIYQLELPADDPADMETAFQILEDWAHGLTLEPEEIDLERGVVIEEWRIGQNASARLRDQQFPVIFQNSRYAERLPIGTLESLETFEHDALRRFYTDWYRPDLMAVIAVGDFETATIEALVRQHFEDIPMPPNPRERTEYGVPGHDETLFSINTDPEIPSTSVAVYHKMDPHGDWSHGGYRDRIVGRLYNSMLNSRFQEIERQPDAPFLQASSAQGSLIRTKAAYALTAAVLENGIERGMEALFREAERVERFGFTESELEREKANILRGMERVWADRANRTSGSYAGEYTRAFLEGESIPGIEYEWELYQRFLPGITLDEVNRLAEEWITEDNRVVLLTGPEKEGVEMPDEEVLNRVLERVTAEELTPYVDSISGEALVSELPEGAPIVGETSENYGITEWTLANGVRVVLKPTEFSEDQVVFRAFSEGGTSLADDEDHFMAQMTASLVAASGLGAFDATELDKVLAGTAASARPYIADYEEGLNGNASLSDLETMFQLIYLRFTAPRIDPVVFDIWKVQTRQGIENRYANPGTQFSDAFARLMSSDHPRRRPPTLETLEDIETDEVFEFYRDRFGDAGDFTFVFVGPIDLETFRPLVERYLGALPSTGREETWRDVGLRQPEGVFEETVNRGLEPVAQTRIAFNGPFDYENQTERTGIRAMALVLDTRLRNRVREELGATYSIGVGPATGWQPVESYIFTIAFSADPERIDELVDTVYEGIETLKAEGPTDSQVADVKETLRRSFETDFQRDSTILGQLVSDYQRDVVPGASIATFNASVEAITAESIQEDARQYLDMNNRVRVTLMPEN